MCSGLVSSSGGRRIQHHIPAGAEERTAGPGGTHAEHREHMEHAHRTKQQTLCVCSTAVCLYVFSCWRPPSVLTRLWCQWWPSTMRLESSSPSRKSVTLATQTCHLLFISEKSIFMFQWFQDKYRHSDHVEPSACLFFTGRLSVSHQNNLS